MFKIVGAELKKIVSKPGIYILSLLLAIILVLGAFIYKPKVYESDTFELNGNTYLEKYEDFNAGIDAGKKSEALSSLQKATDSISEYFIVEDGETYTQKAYIEKLIAKTKENYDEYYDCYANNLVKESDIETIKLRYVSSLENLNIAIESAFKCSQNNSYPIVSTKHNHSEYENIYSEVIKWAKTSVEKENLKNHLLEFENNLSEKFNSSLSNFKYPTLSADFVKTYTINSPGTKLHTLHSRLNSIEEEIYNNYELAYNQPNEYNIVNANKMDELANQYVNTIKTYVSLIKYELLTNAFSFLTKSEELTTLYLSEHSSFNSKSLLERYSYLFENNKSEEDFAKPLTIGVTSNNDINAYDYSYFILRVFSFVIIIYAIMAACHSIAGEVKEGSMRYLAIRPVSRTNLFLGKWLSIVIISTILMLFSFVISLCVGVAVYGTQSNPILTIFNGSLAFTIHPLVMLLIYLASMFFELLIYSIIAMLLSTLFKSDLVSMTILLVVYLLNMFFPVFIQGSNTWLTYYPFSYISLYSLFGSSVYAVSNNFFNLVFGAKVYAGTHIALIASVIVLMITLITLLAIKIFKRKEL